MNFFFNHFQKNWNCAFFSNNSLMRSLVKERDIILKKPIPFRLILTTKL